MTASVLYEGHPISRQRREQIRHRERHAARAAVFQAVKRGKIPPARALSCVDCGDPAVEYDHHRGYAREFWLAVEPVCKKCHTKRVHAFDLVTCPECKNPFPKKGPAIYCSPVCKKTVRDRQPNSLAQKRRRNQEIFGLYQSGLTQVQIAQQFGISQTLVSKAVRKYDPRDHGFKLSAIDVEQIRDRLHRGDPIAPMARDFGVSRGTIHFIRDGVNWRHETARQRHHATVTTPVLQEVG